MKCYGKSDCETLARIHDGGANGCRDKWVLLGPRPLMAIQENGLLLEEGARRVWQPVPRADIHEAEAPPLTPDNINKECPLPVGGLIPGQPGAVDPRLLAGSHADDLTSVGEADRVGLGVLEGHGGHDQVVDGRPRQLKSLDHSIVASLQLTSLFSPTMFVKVSALMTALFLFWRSLNPKTVLSSVSVGI